MKLEWNVALMRRDQLEQGWNDTKLAAESGCGLSTISRWWSGEVRAPRVGKAIALALGHPPARYLPTADEVNAHTDTAKVSKP